MITKDSRNILIADDSMFFRTRLGDILEKAGHRVRFAKSGRDAIAAIEADAKGPDLLTLDMEMSGVSGITVLEWIEANGFKGRFPILVITSLYQPDRIMERLRSLGVTELLTKDFSPQQLVLQVNRLLFPDKAAGGIKQRERVPVSIPVDFICGNAASGFLLNLSETGAFLNTAAGLAKGAVIRLKFRLPGSKNAFEIDGVVRWITADMGINTDFCGGGIMFSSLRPHEREELRVFITSEAMRLGLHGAQ